MSWSLQVNNGDLVLNGAQFGTVTDENKLVQDFRHFILEKMGTDPSYPWYGSLLDGGVKPNGQVVESVIAGTDWGHLKLRIEAEIRRIASLYQNQQVERAKRDRDRYNRSTLSLGEVLAAVNSIDFSQNADALTITIHLQSGRDNNPVVALDLPPVITR
jgi:hypothetical protein